MLDHLYAGDENDVMESMFESTPATEKFGFERAETINKGYLDVSADRFDFN